MIDSLLPLIPSPLCTFSPMPKFQLNANTKVCDIFSSSRGELMGIFMITIMLFHGNFGVLGKFSKIFSLYGHWAVDAFLFISGFGLYYALEKSSGRSLLSFYTRRLMRITPAAVLTGSVLYFCGLAGTLGLIGLNLWYIRTIIILYILAPLLHKFLKTFSPTHVLIVVTLLSTLGVLVSVPLLHHTCFTVQTTISWTLARLPAFALGMYLVRMNFTLKSLLNPVYLLLILCCLLAALYFHWQRDLTGSLSSYLHLLPYILIAFTLPIAITALSFLLNDRIGINRILSRIGSISLELYLVHEAIFNLTHTWFVTPALKFFIAYLLSFICALILATVVRYLVSVIFKITGSGKVPKP